MDSIGKKEITIDLVVDYQKDFVDGSLGFKQAEELDDGIAAELRSCLNAGGYVFATYDSHHSDYLNTREGRNLPVEHTILGTKGWKYFGKTGKIVKNTEGVVKVLKETFGSTKLIGKLSDIAAEGVVTKIRVMGVITNMCVISNAVIAQAVYPEAQIEILGYLCASNVQELHDKALDVMESMQMRVYRSKEEDTTWKIESK